MSQKRLGDNKAMLGASPLAPLSAYWPQKVEHIRGGNRNHPILIPKYFLGVAVISAKNLKRQSVTAKREKSQTPKVLTAILTLPNLT